MNDVFIEQLTSLTRCESKLREELEVKVFRLVGAFFLELGETLAEIDEKRLYKSTHHTFADYCREILDLAARSAYRYIESAEVVKNLLPENIKSVTNWSQNISQVPEITIPQNESQARALVGLEPAEQRKVWSQAVESAPDTKITAAHVRAVVREFKGEKIQEKIERVKRARSANKERMSDKFKGAFDAFLAAVQAEVTGNWRTTDRRTVVRHLDGIRDGISQNGSHRLPDLGYLPEMSNTEKLLEVGLVIYRADAVRMIIETQLGNSEWAIYREYDDVDRLKSDFADLMKNPKNIRG